MARRKNKQISPMRQAINELIEVQRGSGLATPQQLMDCAMKYDLEVWKLESQYLYEYERDMEEDMYHDPIS